MTTVVFDGKYLAGDTQVTHHSHCNSDKSCPDCKRSLDRMYSSVKKIAVPQKRDVKFKGQAVVAMGGAGNLKTMQALCHAIENNIEPNVAYLLIKKSGGVLDASVLVVTDVACWRINTKDRLKVEEVTKFPVAIGSGLPLALFACEYLGMTAFGAVGAALLSDPATGGDIHYVDCRPEDGEVWIKSDTWSEQEMRDHLKEMQHD